MRTMATGPGGKPIVGVMTAGVDAEYGPLEGGMWLGEAVKAFLKFPVDMIVLEWAEGGKLTFRAAGYTMDKDGVEGPLEEKKVITTLTEVMKVRKMWLKVDDYGDKFVATLLFPEEY